MGSARVRVLLATPRPEARGVAWPEPGECAVAIDVLRATTTLTVALGHGARRVRLAASTGEALRMREAEPRALVCGEREGRKPEGFDLGNSPFEYPVPAVSGRTLIFTSTNGSRTLLAAARARRRLLAAFVNLGAVVERLAGESRVVVMCAGKDSRFAIEDAACAGLLCHRLARRGARIEGSGAAIAMAFAPRDGAECRALVQGSAHGRALRAMSPEFARDVEFCAEIDAIDQAFELDAEAVAG